MKSHLPPHRTSRLVIPLVLLALLLTATVGEPQGFASGEEWRPVDPAHLAQKTPIVDPDADAEAIFWDIRVDDGGQDDLVLSHYIRIKIFTELGREKQSKIEIPFLSGTKIKDVAARTIKPDGSIVELTKADIIEKTIVQVSGRKLRSKNFAFPAIEPGAIIEYKWREVISGASINFLRLYFQREIPIQSVTYHLKPSRSSRSFNVLPFNMPRPEFQKEKDGFQSTTVKNMPAFREEPLMPPEDNVRSWAMVEYFNFFRAVLGYQGAATQVYLSFQPFLKVDDEVRRKSAEIVASATTPEEKLEKIFAFCRTNIKNTSDKSSGFTADELEKLKENKKPADTLKRGVGRWIDINFLFAALASAAGFDAHVALIPDRGRRFFDATVVMPGSLHPSHIAVRIAGKTWKFFNPGSPYLPPGRFRWQEEGVAALVADDSPAWVLTPISPAESSKESRVATLQLDENGTLEGDVTIEYTGHLGIERKSLNDDDSQNQREENLKEAVKNRLSTAELTNIVIENVTDPAKPFVYKYHVRVPGYAQRTGKRLFLQPAFFQKGIGALFSASSRRYPIYFHFSWSEEDKVSIKLPKGYATDNADVPPPINAGVSQYKVRMGVTKDNSALIYNRSFSFGGQSILLFPPETYADMKRLFDELNKSDNHTIALRQTTAN
ncbi:MAG: DUF3857 domain-containing protein [Pyrinomonadaceae bacterium]|nr:DUF3857 domain-containing protein [Pyrinomonadaceae bacterium]